MVLIKGVLNFLTGVVNPSICFIGVETTELVVE